MKNLLPLARAGVPLILSGAFFLAVATKVARYAEFTQTLIDSRLVPGGFEVVLAPTLIAFEALIAGGLLIPALRLRSLLGALALSGLFLGYHAGAHRMGIRAPCTCFGLLFRMEPPVGAAVAFGMGLLAATGMELLRGEAVSPPTPSGLEPA